MSSFSVAGFNMLFGDELFFFFFENFIIIMYVFCGGMLGMCVLGGGLCVSESLWRSMCVCGGGVVTHATASLWMSEKNFLESALLPPFYKFWESSSGLQAWVTSTVPCCAVSLDPGHKRLVVSGALVLLLLFILRYSTLQRISKLVTN